MDDHEPDYRYERKLRIVGIERPLVEQMIRNHQAHFLPLFRPRFVNNLYLDTCQQSYLVDHISGVSKRKKVRIRWYGDLESGDGEPQLEIKHKTGWMISKDVFRLTKITLAELLDPQKRRMYLRASTLPESIEELLATLEPALINRYRRTYWRTNDRSVRVTVDDEMTFYRPKRPPYLYLNRFADRAVVLELKYRADRAAHGAAISTLFPFPLEKNSKYVTGLTCLTQS